MSLADPEADIPLNAVEHDRRSTSPQASRGPDSHPGGNVIEDDVQHNVTSLAPVDGGFEAWAFLVGAFVIETVIWGVVNVYGIYLQEYLSDPKIASQPHALSVLPLVGTLSSGIIYCSSPFINVFLYRFPVHRRTAIFFGVALCSASLLGASFATTLLQLVLTQGVLYATGAALTYAPTISYMSEWFVQKRGTAGGVMNAGTALGGLFLPLMLPPLIKAHGAALTLRYLSLAIVIILLPVLPFVKPRLPQGRVHGPGPRTDNKVWLKDWRWWSLLVVSTIQSFGYFVPVIWLPTYAFALNASTSVSALAVALLNGASVIGRIGLGVLADRVSAWLIALCTLLASSLATFLFWGVAGNATAGVMVFGFSYGLLAAGWSSLWTAFVKPMTKNDPRLVTSLLGFLLFSRGLGNIISTPISTALSTGPSPSGARVRSGFDVDGGRFGSTIIYVGTCFAGAAALSLAVWVRERALLRRTAEA